MQTQSISPWKLGRLRLRLVVLATTNLRVSAFDSGIRSDVHATFASSLIRGEYRWHRRGGNWASGSIKGYVRVRWDNVGSHLPCTSCEESSERNTTCGRGGSHRKVRSPQGRPRSHHRPLRQSRGWTTFSRSIFTFDKHITRNPSPWGTRLKISSHV